MTDHPTYETAKRGRKRGRPSKPFLEDEDRYEVALLEMWLRTRINGRRPSLHEAARRAAVLEICTAVEHTFESDGPPAPALAETGHRNAPTKKCFRDGYTEHTLSPRPGHAGALNAYSKRLARKHRSSMKATGQERDWIDHMTDAWQATVYPEVMRRKGLDPIKVCVTAASRAGESEFAEHYLLPLLKEQEGSAAARE